MSKKLKPFLIGATALCVGTSMTVSAFADAPDIVTTTKPVKVMIKPAAKKAAKRKTIIRIKNTAPKAAIATGIKGVVIDEPNQEEGTISIVTDTNEFATIAVGMGTRVSRGAAPAALDNIHTGYVVRCQGVWDQDGFQYRATRVFLGNVVRDTDVVGRVNAACENIARARKGGGFGKSLVAMIPTSSQPRAVVVGEKSQPAPARPAPSPAPANAAPNSGAPGTTPSAPAPQVPAQVPAGTKVPTPSSLL